jgi:tetratricopeptide (TPR) repeat protein
MKTHSSLGIFTLLILLFSCSSKKDLVEKEKSPPSAFENESFHRFFHYPSSEPLLFKKNFNHCYEGKINETLTSFKKNVKKTKGDSFFYNHIAHCYYLKKEYGKAIFFSKYILSTGANKIEKSSSYNLLGMIYLQQNRYRLSLNSFNSGLEVNPGSKVIRYNLAILHLRLNQPREAINLLSSLNTQQDPLVLYILGFAHTMTNNLSEAEKIITQMPDEERKKPERLLVLSTFFFLSNKLDQAKNTLAPLISDKNNHFHIDSVALLKLIKSKELLLETEKIPK